MYTTYLIISLFVLFISFLSIKFEKKLCKIKYFKPYKKILYIFNRVIMVFALLSVVQIISIYFDIKESSLLDIDLLLFAFIISISYFIKRLFIFHLKNMTSNQSIVNKLITFSRLIVVSIILFAILDLLNFPDIYNSIMLISIVFLLTLIIFIYSQERLIIHLDSKKIDKTVVMFSSRLFMIIMVIVFSVVIMQIFQVSTAPLLTLIGAASIAIGLSLQSSLSNLAAGILLIIFRPYKIGDFIMIDSARGTVLDINFLYTEVRSLSGEIIFIPNSLAISGKGVSNFTSCRFTRLDLRIGVDYETDMKKVVKHVLESFNNVPIILKTPKSTVSIHEFSDSAIILRFRIFTRPKDYLALNLEIRSIILEVFRKNQIEIPFNRIVVEMKDNESSKE